MMPSLAAYTAKECDCEWASQHACANGVDDGSICWSPCCSRNQSFDATRLSVSPRHEPLTVNCSVELSVQRGRHELVISTPRSAPSLKSVPLHSRGWTLWLLDIRGKLVARHAMQGSDDPPDPAELLEHAAEPFSDFKNSEPLKERRQQTGRADYAVLGYAGGAGGCRAKLRLVLSAFGASTDFCTTDAPFAAILRLPYSIVLAESAATSSSQAGSTEAVAARWPFLACSSTTQLRPVHLEDYIHGLAPVLNTTTTMWPLYAEGAVRRRDLLPRGNPLWIAIVGDSFGRFIWTKWHARLCPSSKLDVRGAG